MADSHVSAAKRAKKAPMDALHARFPQLVSLFVTDAASKYQLSAKSIDRLQLMLEYNILGGKCSRGFLVVDSVKQLCTERNLDWQTLEERAVVLGWCIEILQGAFLVADDLMDASSMRRGKPCWYKRPSVQNDACNDTLLLESFIYFLLKHFFRDQKDLYLSLLELYHQVALDTQMGQMLDLTAAPQGRHEDNVMERFDIDMYLQIVRYKTACYTFFLPFASALLLCGAADAKSLAVVRSLCMGLGEKFQIQDDYLDCFGDPEVIGKVGTDIQDFKCSWLVVQALTLVTAEQRVILEANYGKHDPACIAKVKALYTDLKLPSLYAKQEEQSHADLLKRIKDAEAQGLSMALVLPILQKIHGRKK